MALLSDTCSYPYWHCMTSQAYAKAASMVKNLGIHIGITMIFIINIVNSQQLSAPNICRYYRVNIISGASKPVRYCQWDLKPWDLLPFSFKSILKNNHYLLCRVVDIMQRDAAKDIASEPNALRAKLLINQVKFFTTLDHTHTHTEGNSWATRIINAHNNCFKLACMSVALDDLISSHCCFKSNHG